MLWAKCGLIRYAGLCGLNSNVGSVEPSRCANFFGSIRAPL